MQVVANNRFNNQQKSKVKNEEKEILNTLNKLKKELDFLHANLDYVTDPILIDGFIYEIKSVHMKYQYYLNLCKEMDIYEKRSV